MKDPLNLQKNKRFIKPSFLNGTIDSVIAPDSPPFLNNIFSEKIIFANINIFKSYFFDEFINKKIIIIISSD